jgi:broad-specificity NMP kinase
MTRSAATEMGPVVANSSPASTGTRWSCGRGPLSVRGMSGLRLPVIWVCGASGAGKSVAAWGLYEELAAAGARVAYVDIDQLGMLYPVADDDPAWHHALKGEALAAVLPGYVAAGAQLLVVSGVVDPHEGPRKQLPRDTDLTLCLLAPDPAVLRERILARGWSQADADEAAAENDVLRAAPFVDRRIETTELSVAETVARLRDVAHVGGEARETGSGATSSSSTGVVVVTGPRAAGSSTVGFGLAVGRWRAGRRTGFLDLQQLGFIARTGRTGSESVLAISQLAAMHELMTERGAELVVSGHLSVPDRALLRMALPRATVTVVRLRADERTLADHVRARVGGSDARLAADDLLDADQHHQDAVMAAALAEQRVLDTAPADDDAVLDVSGRSPAEVIADVARLTNP